MTPVKHNFHGRLKAMNGVLFGNSTIENPEIGLIATVNGQVCVYDNVGGTIGWYPIAKAMDTKTFRHIQADPSTEWTVTHNLGTKEFFAVVTDDNDNSIVSYAGLEYDPINPLNKFKVFFAEPISGNMFIVVAESFSTPELNTSKITLGDLVISTSGISWQGNYINMATFTAVDESINTLANVVTALSSDNNTIRGQISTEVQRATAAEAALRSDLNSLQQTVNTNVTAQVDVETQRAKAAESDLRNDLNNLQQTINTSLSQQVNSEAQRAIAAEAALSASIQSVQTNMQKYAGYDLTFSDAGNVASGQVVFDMLAVRPFSIPANMAGAVAVADVGPAAATTFNVTVNGVIKFAFTYAASATTATFATNPALNIAVGDRVRIVASRADAAIKNIAATIPTTLL